MRYIQFNKERLTYSPYRISREFINNVETHVINEEITDMVIARFDTFVLSRLNEHQTITVYRQWPKWIRWIMRKPIAFEITINVKEVVKNPPQLPEGRSVLLYEISEG